MIAVSTNAPIVRYTNAPPNRLYCNDRAKSDDETIGANARLAQADACAIALIVPSDDRVGAALLM